jgi:hypothetical protein
VAESSEVKAFFREASNQKGRSESERNRRRNNRVMLESPNHTLPVMMAVTLVEGTGVSTQGGFRRTEGGNSGEVSGESPEGLRASQDDP